MMRTPILICCTLIMPAGFLMTGCSGDDNKAASEPPLFTATMVDMTGPYDPADSTFGDIKFIEPVLTPFGFEIDQYHRSPAIEYFTVPNAPVRAVTKGLITAIRDNPIDQGDFEVEVTSEPGTNWVLIYDHVLDVRWAEGTVLAPGDTIGEAGNWNAYMRRVELQVNLVGNNNNAISYCPLNFGDSTFIERHKQLLSEYNLHGFTPTFDTLCIVPTVVP